VKRTRATTLPEASTSVARPRVNPEFPTFDVRAHFREVVRARPTVRDVLQRLAAGMQRAVDVGVFEFVGHHAGDGVSVFAGEGRSPVLFEFDERGLGLRLIFRAIGGKRGRREGQQNRERGWDFHAQIVT